MLRSDAAFLASGLIGFSSISPALIQQCKDGYDRLDVQYKTVLDIGADWGNSVVYFWTRGATKIIAYESDWRKRISLRRLKDRGVPVDVRYTWPDACEYPKADVLKMDCEGCERGLQLRQLEHYKQWAIAVHENRNLAYELEKRGAVLAHKQKGEEVWVKA